MRQGRKCHYKNCGHNSTDNRISGHRCTFYPMPKDPITTAHWLKAGAIYHLTPKRVTAHNCFICSCHFLNGKSEGPVEFIEEYDSGDPDPGHEQLEGEGQSRKRMQSFCPTGLTPSSKRLETEGLMTPGTKIIVESLLTLREDDVDHYKTVAGRRIGYSPLRAFRKLRENNALKNAQEKLKNMMDAGTPILPDNIYSEAGDDLGVTLLPPSPISLVEGDVKKINFNIGASASRRPARNILADMVELETEQSLHNDFDAATLLPSPALDNNNNYVKESGCTQCSNSQVKEVNSVAIQCDRWFVCCYEKAKRMSVKDFTFFTGLSQDAFETLFWFLGGNEVCSKLKYSYTQKTPKKKQFQGFLYPKDKLFMTLLRLRRGIPLRDLKTLFGISEGYASRVVYTWVRFMSLQFKKLDDSMFTTAEAQNGLRPKCYKDFPNLRVIIDSSEFRIQKPYNFQQQSNTFSDYKSGNTIKVLIGTSCHGGLSYISEAVEGSITDRQLLIKSGLLDKMHPNEAVMADKGFDAEDLFDERDLELLTPAFLGNRQNFTGRELILNRAIAVSRIHVETFIGRIKQFRLVRYTIPNSMLPIASDLVRVCAFLVNFQRPFIKDDNNDEE